MARKTVEQYETEMEGSTVFFKEMSDWIYGATPVDFLSPDKNKQMAKMLGYNRDYLTGKCGKQQFCVSYERRFYVWRFGLPGNTLLWILTAPEIGTSIQYIGDVRNVKTKLIEIFDLNESILNNE